MPSFTYKAKDQSGNIVNGAVDAVDSHLAAAKIREMGYWPIEVLPARVARAASQSGFGNPIWTGVSLRSLAVFFRQLATMLQAGMNLGESLDNLGKQRGMGRLPVIACGAAERVRHGGMLSDVLSDHPYIFSPIQIGLVKAGEVGGMLDSMIERIAVYLERELELRHKFSRATMYPKIIAVFIVLAIVFIPHVKEIVDKGWPVVINILINKLLPVTLALIILYMAIKLLLTMPPIRFAWDSIKLNFPILGPTVRKMAMSRFAMSLSVTYSAGMPLSQAVELSCAGLGNEVLRQAISASVPQIQAGGLLSDTLKRAGGVPDLVLGMITTGEKTGSLDLVLDKVCEYYNTEAETTLEKLSYILFVGLILIAAIVVLMIVSRFYMGHFDLNQYNQ